MYGLQIDDTVLRLNLSDDHAAFAPEIVELFLPGKAAVRMLRILQDEPPEFGCRLCIRLPHKADLLPVVLALLQMIHPHLQLQIRRYAVVTRCGFRKVIRVIFNLS